MAKAKSKITRLASGRFWPRGLKDSRGKPDRTSFKTRAEAQAYRDQFVAQKAKGEVLLDSRKATFNDALDLLIKRDVREGLEESTRERRLSDIKVHLRPMFGARKLSEFSDRRLRMKFAQDWLDHRAKEGIASESLIKYRSYIRLALGEAIDKGLLAGPNPVDDFKIRVPKINKKADRQCLALEEMSKLVGIASKRHHGEDENSRHVRFLLVLFGLLLGLRNDECGAVCWDYVDFDDRVIHIRRCMQKGVLVDTTKTGESGYRTVPMSPILFDALIKHRDVMLSQGYEVKGRVPVLRPGRAELVSQTGVDDHWGRLAKKAEFIDQETWQKDHTFYALRHTCFNIWRTIGMKLDDMAELMGHTTIITANKHYKHSTPQFAVIRREVEALGLRGAPPEDLIYGLGFVLARRWRADGIDDIGCAEPHSMMPQLGNNGSMKLLPGNIIDVVPTALSIDPPALGPDIRSMETLKAWQLVECQKLDGQGWTKRKIAKHLGLCTGTISNLIRTAPNAKWMRKAGREERAALQQQAVQLREQNPLWSSTDIAKALGVKPHLVVIWERKRGKPMPHRPGAHKLGKHQAVILEMFEQGKTYEQIGKAIGHPHSSVAYFIKRLGLAGKQKHRTSGVNLDLYKDRIIELIAQGKNNEQIARELDKASRSGIIGFIGRNGLRKPAESSPEGPKTPAE